MQRKAHLLRRLKRDFPDWEFDCELGHTVGENSGFWLLVVILRAYKEGCRVMVASDRCFEYKDAFTQEYYWRIVKALKS